MRTRKFSMPSKSKKHLVTAALPYANGPLHIGHLAGAYLPADIYVRYLKSKGEEVVFVCGSDEHGAAITLRAKKEGKSPSEIVNQYHELNDKAFKTLGIDFDIFHRTSDPLHHQTAKDFFLTLEQKGVFTKETSEQFYDESYGQFLADRYITGQCPKCDYENAYGDQCENCGSALSPNELIHPKSTLSGEPPILKTTTHWYLPMQDHESWLKEWIEKGTLEGQPHHRPEEWRNQVIGQCKSWLDAGLKPRAMTRDLDWGVKVPLKDAKGKVLYVWLDAPIGYITATKAWAEQNKTKWEDLWQDQDTELVHFIGKDNIVFHCIIFPILLKAHGKFILPKNVPANEFLNLEGKKISTSRNWAVWLHEYIHDFPEKEDVLRYVICSISPEQKDSEFTWEDFQARNNNELVAIFGNFINRTIVLTDKYFGGQIPESTNLEQYDSVVKELKRIVDRCTKALDKFQFRLALNEAMAISRLGNKFLADEEPWKLIKTDEEKVKDILYLSIQICANACIALAPFIPKSCQKLQKMIGLDSIEWIQLGSIELISSKSTIKNEGLLFEKIEKETIQKVIQKLTESQDDEKQLTYAPMKENISFEEFQKIDLRLGTIQSAEKVEKSSKLLKLRIDLGFEERTIVSGIAKYYTPKELIGKQVEVIVNLAARKIMGIESQGMLLMAEDPVGKLSLLKSDKDISNGSIIN